MHDEVDLGIYSEVPFLDKLQRWTSAAVQVAFGNLISRFAWSLIASIAWSIILSSELRASLNGKPLRVAAIILLFALFGVLTYLFSKFGMPKLVRLVFGPPVFGKLGGLPATTYATSVKCASAITFEFRPDDMKRVREFNRIDRDVTEEVFKRAYRAITSEPQDPGAFDKEWAKLWNNKLLKFETKAIGGQAVTFEEVLSDDNLALRVETPKLVAVSSLISSLVGPFALIMMLLVFRLLNGQANLLLVVQTNLFLSLVLSSLLYSFYVHQNAEIPFLTEVPANLAKLFRSRTEKFAQASVRPTRVSITSKQYLTVARDYFSRLLFAGSMTDALTILVMIGVTLLFGFVMAPMYRDHLLNYYAKLALAVVLIPFGLLFGYYLTFLALQHARLILAPVIAGLLMATLPYVLNYLFSGQVELADIRNAIVAAGSAIGTTLIATVTAKVKSVTEGSAGSGSGYR